MTRDEPMKRITFLIAFFVFIAAVPTSLSAQSLKVGTFRVVITPPEGHPMGGSYQTRLNEGTVDDLYAKTLFLESGGERVALVALDLVAISDQDRKSTRLNSSHVKISYA